MGAKVLEAQGTLGFLACSASTPPQASPGVSQDT